MAAVTSILPTAVSSTAKPVLAADLLCGADTLMKRLCDTTRDEQWLDAFLLAAGLGQLVDDRLHSDPLLLHRAASYLRGRPSWSARLAGAVAGALGAVDRIRIGPANRRLVRAHHALATLTVRLAGQVLAPQHIGDLAPLLRATLPAAPALAGDLLRIPASFHSFDQHPDDVQWLVRAFRRQYTRDTPLCVVGVRTSGSYLAPLHAAALRATGKSRVELLSYRPGRPFLRSERTMLRAIASAGGLVLVTDDPPVSGASLATTAGAIAHAGVPDSRIVFLLSLFGSRDDLPERLSRWSVVVQPWADWSVHRRLAAQPVKHALSEMVDSSIEVGEVRPLGPPCPARERAHVRARFEVLLSDRHTGEAVRRHIMVEGAGLGYLGRQSAAVADALPGYVPHVYGFADGLLYRDWLPSSPEPIPDYALADAVADYVTARRRAVPTFLLAGPVGRPKPRLGGRCEVAVRPVRAALGARAAAAARAARAAVAHPR